MPKSLITGGSVGLGRAIAERLAAQGHELFLVASRLDPLAEAARDIAARHGVTVHHHPVDLASLDARDLRRRVLDAMGAVDNLLLIAGVGDKADGGPMPDGAAERLLAVNLVSAVTLTDALLPDLQDNPQANIVAAGSIAAARGRRRNGVYGAAKRGLEAYFETLRHYLAQRGGVCKTQIYRLGYLDTRMIAGQKTPFAKFPPDKAAERIVANLGRDLGLAYLPVWYWPIVTAFRLLPWPIFKRLDV